MREQSKLFKICSTVILSVLTIATIYPFFTTIITSMTTQSAYMRDPLMLYPKEFNLDSYTYVLHNEYILRSLINSVLISVFGTAYSILLTVCAAYALSKTNVPGVRVCMKLIVVTMFFGGGLIPSYLLIRNLHLMDSLLALILPAGISTFYMIIMKNAFLEIPKELDESARMDGANDLVILFRIMLPLIKPTLACIVLFYAVDKWNEWYSAMLYIRSQDKYPLMFLLKNMVTNLTANAESGLDAKMMQMAQAVYPVGVQKATILFTIIPVMMLYPFMQRYFMKGIMVGAVKG